MVEELRKSFNLVMGKLNCRCRNQNDEQRRNRSRSHLRMLRGQRLRQFDETISVNQSESDSDKK